MLQVDEHAVGQIGLGVVEDQLAVLHVGLGRLHHDGSLAVTGVDGHAAVFVLGIRAARQRLLGAIGAVVRHVALCGSRCAGPDLSTPIQQRERLGGILGFYHREAA